MKSAFNAAELGMPEHVCCPFCQKEEHTSIYSPFGSQLSVATYWCKTCHTAFEWLKRKSASDGLPMR